MLTVHDEGLEAREVRQAAGDGAAPVHAHGVVGEVQRHQAGFGVRESCGQRHHTRVTQPGAGQREVRDGRHLYSDEKVANRDTKVWHMVIENGY